MDCGADWSELNHVAGPFLRPGGPGLTERALEICCLPSGSLVADIGCGAGGTLEYLRRLGDYRLVGLDRSETLLAASAAGVTSAGLVRGKAESLPFRQESLDALLCECVLSVVADKTASLHEFAGALKNGGYFVLSDVFYRGGTELGGAGPQSPGLTQKGLSGKEEILGALTDLGFALLLWEEHDRILKEFAARIILADVRLPDLWCPGQGRVGLSPNRAAMSYFLLVAKKTGRPMVRRDTRETMNHGRCVIPIDEPESKGLLLCPDHLDPRLGGSGQDQHGPGEVGRGTLLRHPRKRRSMRSVIGRSLPHIALRR
jgi:arsenite methyltransferase